MATSLASVCQHVLRCYSPANSHLLNTHRYQLPLRILLALQHVSAGSSRHYQSSPDASRMYWPLPARPLPTAAAAANSLNGARPGSKADGAKVAAATASGPMLFLNVIADGALRRCG
jgi:hypothetical protein